MKSFVQDKILRLEICNPEHGNSFGASDARFLLDTLRKHEKSDEVVGMILSATGRLFCAGGNLKDYAQMTKASDGHKVNTLITEALNTLATWPKPTAAVIQGDCFGGGVEVLSAVDKVFCAPHVFLGLWQRRIGLTFGWGGGARLEARVGLKKLQLLALETRVVSASEALTAGLVDEIVMTSSLGQEAKLWVVNTAAHPAAPVPYLKRFALNLETKFFRKLWMNPEHRAVLEQRRKR